MTLEARTRALVDLVEADRARRCNSILDEARARRAEVLAAAHAEARRLVRAAFEEERHRFAARTSAARARMQTHKRLREQRVAADLLKAGLQLLPQMLCERWQQVQSRQAWFARAAAAAERALPQGDWQIVHAPGLTEAEARDATPAAVTPTLLVDASLRAGLRISAGGNVVDGALTGLLADRADIGAKLLTLLEQQP
ncbi:MAG TPA: hypothetical protein VMN56_03845 [Casimicrobiaceae bacterium]|nr:hypothetical protein [Casimicrobiaceae bacterium]